MHVNVFADLTLYLHLQTLNPISELNYVLTFW